MAHDHSHAHPTVPTLLIGLSGAGEALLEAALAREELEVVGVVDAARAGEPLQALGGEAVAASAKGLWGKVRGGLVIVNLGDRLADVVPTLEAAAKAEVNVVSPCAELAFPWFADPDQAEALERRFSKAGVSCLGAGVSPGFVSDRLPSIMGSLTHAVEGVRVRRRLDLRAASPDRLAAFGVGLEEGRFLADAEADRVGQRGLGESAAMIAEGLGLQADEVDEEIQPLLAAEAFELGGTKFPAGTVCGARQVLLAFEEGVERVRIEIEAQLDHEAPSDTLELEATPPLRLEIPGGVPAAAEVWAVINAGLLVVGAQAGVMTVLDLPGGR